MGCLMHKNINWILFFVCVLFAQANARETKFSPYFVDVTTGRYCPIEKDIIVQGPLPFVLERSWEYESSSDTAFIFGWAIKAVPLSPQFDGLELVEKKFTDGNLKSVEVLGKSKETTYGSVSVDTLDFATLNLKTHHGISIKYQHEYQHLSKVIHHDGSQITYEYYCHPTTGELLITKRDEGDNRYLINEYYEFGINDMGDQIIVIDDIDDPRIAKMRLQKAPAGTDDTPVIVAKYFYEHAKTIVQDAYGKETIYLLDEDETCVFQIEEPFNTEQESHKRIHRYFWRLHPVTNERLLTSEVLTDETGHIFECKTKQYNAQAKLIKETLWGNLSGQCMHQLTIQSNGVPHENGIEHFSTYYAYYESMPDLVKEQWEDSGKGIEWIYNDQGYLIRKSYKNHGKIIGSQHFIYNEEGILCGYCDEKPGENGHYIEATYILSDDDATKGMPYLIEEKGIDEEGERTLIRTTYKQYTDRAELQKLRVFNGHGDCLQESAAAYDLSGRPVFVCDTNGQSGHFIYDIHGNVLLSSDDASKTIKTSQYDYSNRVIRTDERLHDGQLLSSCYRYNFLNQAVIFEDNFGNETRYLYDAWNRLKAIIYPTVTNENGDYENPIVKYKYDIADNKTMIIDPKGYATRISYNTRHQPIEIVYPDKSVEIMEYALDGRILALTSKNGAKTIYQYDELGQLIGEDEIAGFDPPSAIKVYDRSDWVADTEEIHFEPLRGQNLSKKSRVNANGSIEEITFDALGRPECIIVFNSLGQLLAKQILRYDLVGNKVGQIDYAIANGEEKRLSWTCWKYGPANRLEAMIEGVESEAEKLTQYYYNEQGEMAEICKPDGTSLIWEYDDAGRVIRFYASDFSFAYDYKYEEGNAIRFVENLQSHQISVRNFDKSGCLTEELLQNGLHVKRDIDDQGRISLLHLPDGSAIKYVYDEDHLSKIERLCSSGNILYAYEYLKYDEKGRPLTAQLIGSLGTISFTWDEDGHCIAIDSPYYSEDLEIVHGCLKTQSIQTRLGKITNQFQYDELQQLIEETGIITNSYRYDSTLNRLSKNNAPVSVNSLNQTVQDKKNQYVYDRSGNLIQKNSGNQTTFYLYDALNRLTEAHRPEAFRIKYTYDAFHRRMSRSCSLWNNKLESWETTPETYFLYDDNQEIGAADDFGNIVELRVLGNGLGAEIGAAVAIELKGDIYAPIHDHRGNIVCLINARSNQPVEYYLYSAYGEPAILNGYGEQIERSLVGNPWRFSSKRCDDETGLVHYGRRDYDPAQGKWISPDPFGFVESPNRYAFLLNNPMLLVDFYGLFSIQAVWQNFKEAAVKWLYTASDLYNKAFSTAYTKIGQIGEFLMGKNLFLISGFYVEPPDYGTYGKGELFPKLRITFINGLFNLKHHFLYLIKLISESYGGNNVHYIYKGIEGWGKDMYKSLFIKAFKFISKDARQLAATWKKLIEEMGGVKEGGVIIHFAHSIGGTETARARKLMQPEELGMIRVVTFGSPTMVSKDGFQDVVNIISCRDGVSMGFDPLEYFKALMNHECNFDPLGYFRALMGTDCNIVMIGTFKRCFTCNFKDHNFVMYWDHWLTFEDPKWSVFVPKTETPGCIN